MYDSFQVYFDQRNNAVPAAKYDGDDVVYSVGLDKAGKPVAYLEKSPSGRFVGENNAMTGIDRDVTVAYRRTERGYDFEVLFPPAALPFLKLTQGSLLGFSVFVHDNDGVKRKQDLVLGPVQMTPFRHPWAWKCVKLVNDAPLARETTVDDK